MVVILQKVKTFRSGLELYLKVKVYEIQRYLYIYS